LVGPILEPVSSEQFISFKLAVPAIHNS
jgi:hypothetical protein